jgi:hypothetical protein
LFKEYKFNFNTRLLKDALNINFLVGYSLISQNNLHDYTIYETSFNSNQLNFGTSLELFFNSVEKKSSFITSLMYFLNSEIDDQEFGFGSGNPNYASVKNDLSLLTLDLKYRQYYKLKNNNYLFINAGVGINLTNGKTSYIRNSTNDFIADLDYDSASVFLTFGIGYNIKKLSLELNYIPKFNNVFNPVSDNINFGNWKYNRQIANLSLSYEIF